MADGWGASDWGTPASANGAGDGGKPRGKGCYNCNEEGHMSKDCPNPPKERKTGCFNCKEEGHMSKDCPNPKAERKIECRKCGEEGHMSRECPQNGGDGERKKGCFKCGDEGHISRECPQNGGDGEKKSGCFKCGEEGHISRECPKNEGPPPDHYKPEEEAEDQLYEHGISSGINFAKYSEIQVKVSGENPPPPIKDFEESGLRPLLLENIKKSHYTKPTPVQRYAIPMIRAGRDLMACAQTGSGKTAAFLLPVLHKLLEDGVEAHACMTPQEPEVVVIAPTRELAIQIKDEARKFATGSMIKSVVVYGGTSVMFQSDQLTSKGVNVLIATPGRLLDFVEKGKVSFGKLRFLILDEADRMLDMGFMPDVQRMVSNANMPKKGERQTLMFSATFPQEVQEVAREFLDNYLFLAVGIVGGACTDVAQTFHQVGKFEKREKLMEILKETPAESKDKTLVFVEAKKTADFLATFLSQNQLSTTSIHGDRLQREREQALNDFKTGKHPILVATAVAARGLDIRNVSHVINFDMPKSIDEYVHRIGRTGRVGNIGRATSFFDSQSDNEIAQPLVKVLTDSQQDVPDFLVEAASGGYGGAAYSGGGAFGGSDIRGGAAATEEVW